MTEELKQDERFVSGPVKTYSLMELVRGTDLTTYCEEKEPTRRQIIGLMIQVCEGIGHAHANQIVHRDIKPRNIMVTETGEVKVVDFGLAKAIEQDPELSDVSTSGELIGTPLYMSPEQALADGTPITAASSTASCW